MIIVLYTCTYIHNVMPEIDFLCDSFLHLYPLGALRFGCDEMCTFSLELYKHTIINRVLYCISQLSLCYGMWSTHVCVYSL